VRIAVQLDDQPFRSCRKIGDVWSDNDLTLELHAQAIASQKVTKPLLGLGEVCPQRLRSGASFEVAFHTTDSPLSQPSPPEGGEGLMRSLRVMRRGFPGVWSC